MERAQRRLLVQYPKRQVGNRMFGGESSHLPLKINVSGVIPPIFASSILLMPATVANFNSASMPDWLQTILTYISHGQPLYLLLYALLIIFFAFFYTSIIFNPEETAENLKKYGGFIPGIRPGKKTAEYIDYRADAHHGRGRALSGAGVPDSGMADLHILAFRSISAAPRF